jgi:cell division protein FtsQ
VVVGAVLACLALGSLLVVRYSPLFQITSITSVAPTEHVTANDIAALAALPGGTTMFTLDRQALEESLLSDPWVASVAIERNFPHSLLIAVTEYEPAAVVMLASGLEAWYIASDGTWLEEFPLAQAADGEVSSTADLVRTEAAAQGLTYVCEVGSQVRPEAGTVCDDAAVLGVLAYLEGFSESFRGAVLTAKASSEASISVVLSSGIEVSLGAPTDIALKEEVVNALLAEYPGQVTYVNARTPDALTWRGLDASVAGGTAEDVPDTTAVAQQQAASDASDAADVSHTSDADVAADDSSTVVYHDVDPDDPYAEGTYYEEGGFRSEYGTWIYAYYDENGTWICGYYDAEETWHSLA